MPDASTDRQAHLARVECLLGRAVSCGFRVLAFYNHGTKPVWPGPAAGYWYVSVCLMGAPEDRVDVREYYSGVKRADPNWLTENGRASDAAREKALHAALVQAGRRWPQEKYLMSEGMVKDG
jgi:hypothetical protein